MSVFGINHCVFLIWPVAFLFASARLRCKYVLPFRSSHGTNAHFNGMLKLFRILGIVEVGKIMCGFFLAIFIRRKRRSCFFLLLTIYGLTINGSSNAESMSTIIEQKFICLSSYLWSFFLHFFYLMSTTYVFVRIRENIRTNYAHL